MAGHCPGALPPIELGDHNYFAYAVLDDIDAYHGKVGRRRPADQAAAKRAVAHA